MNKLVEIGKELYKKQRSLDKEVNSLFKEAEPHLEIRLKHYYKGRKKAIELIVEDGLRYEFEYNDACNCHPEYCTDNVIIYWEDLLLTPEEYDVHLFQIEKKEKELKEKQKREEKKKNKQEIEAQEKKLFEELKKKYEIGKT